MKYIYIYIYVYNFNVSIRRGTIRMIVLNGREGKS